MLIVQHNTVDHKQKIRVDLAYVRHVAVSQSLYSIDAYFHCKLDTTWIEVDTGDFNFLSGNLSERTNENAKK